MLNSGMDSLEVAARLEVSARSVLRWGAVYAQGGTEALAAKSVPGRPRKLGPADLERLWAFLLRGAPACGFPNDLWTLKRIAQVIRREFGVHYHPSHVWKLLRQADWSCQVPERRAVQRDEKAIAHWQRYKWPHIKKSPKTGRPPQLH
jgi:transposase